MILFKYLAMLKTQIQKRSGDGLQNLFSSFPPFPRDSFSCLCNLNTHSSCLTSEAIL